MLALVYSLALLKRPFYIRDLVMTYTGCRHRHDISLDVIFLKICDDEHVVIMFSEQNVIWLNFNKLQFTNSFLKLLPSDPTEVYYPN